MNINQIATVEGVSIDAIKKRIKRLLEKDKDLSEKFPDFKPSVEEDLPEEILKLIHKSKTESKDPGKEPKKKKSKSNQLTIREILPIIPLPMLGLAASWGVYHFAKQFAPVPVAVVECTAFEFVYIGLAFAKLNDKQRKRANWISIGAVVVSVIYNVLSGAMFQKIDLFVDPTWIWIMSIIHGMPIAVLAYFVADLSIHSKK